VHSGINWSATSSPFNQPLKVIIVGSPSSGKTAWATGAWSFGIGDSKQTEDRSSNAASALKNYTPTTVASLFEPAIFKTTRGRDVVFKLWDLPGASEFQPHADGYFVGADAALIFFDTTSKTSYQDVAIWYREVVRVCGLTLPIALVRTKVDDSEHMELKPRHISFHRKKGIPLIDVSTKLSFQILKPLVWIARRIAGDEELRFAQDPLPQAFPDRENLLLSETSSLSSVSALGVSSAPSVATSTSSSLNAHLASGLSISLSAPSTPPLGSRTDSLSPANSDARPSSSSTTDVLATGVDAVSLQN
jgi:GTP-binding nuclear protein Ran